MENKIPHTLNITEANKVVVTGVAEVVSATNKCVFAKLDNLCLQLDGQNLKVEKLSPEEKLLQISGQIFNIRYSGQGTKNLIKRIFK